MAIGGGEDNEKACLILKEFVRLAGDNKESRWNFNFLFVAKQTERRLIKFV